MSDRLLIRYVDGPEQVKQDMERIKASIPSVSLTAVQQGVQRGLEPESKEECPKDTGTLVSSWSMDVLSHNSSETELAFGYGGAASQYALYVHETPPSGVTNKRKGHMTMNWRSMHQAKKGKYYNAEKGREIGFHTATHASPTKWKYLEDPVNRHIDDPLKHFCEAMDAVIMNEGAGGGVESMPEEGVGESRFISEPGLTEDTGWFST
jgi:hypothetical protein